MEQTIKAEWGVDVADTYFLRGIAVFNCNDNLKLG